MPKFVSDILLDNDNKFLISKGDFTVGLSDNQHIAQIIDSNRGEWLFHPLTGVGIVKFLNGALSYAQVQTLITQQLKLDGYTDIDFNINEEDLITQFVLADNFVINIAAYRPE